MVAIPREHSCNYLSRGSWSSPSQLMDHQGKVVWTSPEKSGVDDSDAGDINGDGKLEIVVGYNGGSGVSLFDSTGKLLWNKPDGNVWDIDMVDTNQDGKLEIVHSNTEAHLNLRDAQGNILQSTEPNSHFSFFTLAPWPDSRGLQHPLYQHNNTIYILNYDGTVLKQFKAPNVNVAYKLYGTPVKLDPNQPDYFAVVFNFSSGDNLVLYLYNSEGNLVYREVVDKSGEAIYALHNDATNTDTLLVGGNGKVLQYNLKKP